jgi:hypothetical protein
MAQDSDQWRVLVNTIMELILVHKINGLYDNTVNAKRFI